MTEITSLVKKLDLFQRIDEGYLATPTVHGGTISLVTYICIGALAIFEFSEFMGPQITSTVVMDVNQDQSLLIWFDITMLDLPCKYVAVDVYDFFGMERQNVTKDIAKTRMFWVDGELKEGDAHMEKDLKIVNPTDVPREIELDKDGHHALDIVGGDLAFVAELRSHNYTLISFYAPWSSLCKAFAPIYEKAAIEFDKLNFPNMNAKFASLNCETDELICKAFAIKAYPTLLIFNRDNPLVPYYSGERTVDALVEYLKSAVLKGATNLPKTFHDQACRIEGTVLAPRVPGNFHLEARSITQDISPSMTNVSHIVNHLQFGERISPALEGKLPTKHQFLMHPLDGRVFLLQKIHTAPQHYIKVVTVIYEYNDHQVQSYQLATQTRIASFDELSIPEAKFSYELSPVSVKVSQNGKPLYSFLTSLFAIIGGTFTVVSLLDGAAESVNVRFKKILRKLS